MRLYTFEARNRRRIGAELGGLLIDLNAAHAAIDHLGDGHRFYHYGDTALFSDMKLQAELYQPTIGALGIANPLEILHRFPMPGAMLTGELSPREGILAAQWLGLKTILPCHYTNPDNPDLHEFQRRHAEAKRRGDKIGESVVLKPGDWLELTA